jgi:CRISPR-associated protein Cas2
MMHLILIYDVTEDRIRTKIASACEDYGLDRIQFSAFAGRLSHNHQEELMLRVEGLLGETPGRIQLIPISTDQWDKRMEVCNDAG